MREKSRKRKRLQRNYNRQLNNEIKELVLIKVWINSIKIGKSTKKHDTTKKQHVTNQ